MSIFGKIEDPRSDINQLHNLVDILLIGMISVICGAETWEHMTRLAKSKEVFLKSFLELPNGIPSKDTLNRTFSSIDSGQFETCFIEWVNSIIDLNKGQVIAIDGKNIRGAKSNGKKSPIHMVSAWACENNMVLGQVKTNEKSNEITAIPELLKALNLEGNTITIDAIGTQKEIAKEIIKSNARGKPACDLLMLQNVTPAHKGAPYRLIIYLLVNKRCPCWAYTMYKKHRAFMA